MRFFSAITGGNDTARTCDLRRDGLDGMRQVSTPDPTLEHPKSHNDSSQVGMVEPFRAELAAGARKPLIPSKQCYFCGSPIGNHQVCGSPQCQDKAVAILRADLDYDAVIWAARIDPPSRRHVASKRVLAAFLLLTGLVLLLALPFIIARV
jgi:hypothetical protein